MKENKKKHCITLSPKASEIANKESKKLSDNGRTNLSGYLEHLIIKHNKK